MSEQFKIDLFFKAPVAEGKSTALVLVAQALAKLGFEVEVPKHLVGLTINTELLNKNRTESTKIVLHEVWPDDTGEQHG